MKNNNKKQWHRPEKKNNQIHKKWQIKAQNAKTYYSRMKTIFSPRFEWQNDADEQ